MFLKRVGGRRGRRKKVTDCEGLITEAKENQS